METLTGYVEHIIFQNAENGYTVLRLLTEEGEVITVVGCIPCTAPGEHLAVSGVWETHPQHGEQLKALDASAGFMGVYGKTEIPTLREYMELVKDLPLITNIELKTNIYEYEGLEKRVYDRIKEFRLQDRVINSGFNHYSVMRMKALAPERKYGFPA